MTTTTDSTVLLHRVPGDPLRERIVHEVKAATWVADDRGQPPGVVIFGVLDHVAAELGIGFEDAAAAIGVRFDTSDLRRTPDGPGDHDFTMTVIPDGVRACFASDCTHAPGYTPA